MGRPKQYEYFRLIVSIISKGLTQNDERIIFRLFFVFLEIQYDILVKHIRFFV